MPRSRRRLRGRPTTVPAGGPAGPVTSESPFFDRIIPEEAKTVEKGDSDGAGDGAVLGAHRPRRRRGHRGEARAQLQRAACFDRAA